MTILLPETESILAAPAPTQPGPAHAVHVSFRSGVVAAFEPDGRVRLDLAGRPVVRLNGLSPSSAAALASWQWEGTADGGRSAPRPVPPPDRLASAELSGLRQRLGGLTAWAAWGDRGPSLVLESTDRVPTPAPNPVPDTAVVRLSRFAITRRRDDHVVLESPLARARAVLVDPAWGQVLAGLGAGTAVGALVAQRAEPAVWRAGVDLLVGAGLLDIAATDGRLGSDSPAAHYPVDDDPVLRQWELPDLYFHSRSRLGRTDEPFGGVFPFRGELDPLPAVRPHHEGPVIELPTPDYDDIQRRDPSLLTVMEGRRSTRTFGSEPLTVTSLAELLYRSARVRGTYGPHPEAGLPYPASSRPYPCGGAGYELEFYLTVRRVEGLEPGSYHYEADTHRLRRLGTSAEERGALLQMASTSAGGGVDPDVLVTITSRFQRLSWKYRSIAYAVTLKHVGVVYQTLYLVATAMGIGACGLGSGDSDVAAQAFGLDYLQETSVGEFILGSLPTSVDLTSERGGAAPRPAYIPSWSDGLHPEWYRRAAAELRER